MSRAALFAGSCAIPLIAAVATGSSEQTPQRDVEVREAVRADVDRLGSSDRAERLDAEQDLLGRGTRALPLLPASKDIRDPAARAGLERIRKRLEEKQAEESKRPTLLSVRERGSLGDLASKMAGPNAGPGPFVLSPGQAERTVALDVDEAPFWSVVDDIASQADLWPDEVDPFGRLSFRDRTSADVAKRLGYSQAFRLAAGPVSLKPMAGSDRRHLVRVPLEVRAEPRLRPLFLSYAASDFQLTTAGGEVLATYTPQAKHELPFDASGDRVELRLDFVSADRPAEPLTLSGKVRLTVATGEERFTGAFAETQTTEGVIPVERTVSRGGVSVQFREMTLRPDGTAEVEIAVVYDQGGPAFESHRAWIYHNVAELTYHTEADGEWMLNRLDHEPGLSTVAQSNGGVVLRYRFAGIPPEAKSITSNYAAPTNIVEVPVEIAIGDLTLPSEPLNAGSAGGP